MNTNIQAVNSDLAARIQARIDAKTKPIGALGQLESTAKKIALIQNSLEPKLKKAHILLFAGDHGLCDEGISPYPQAVTGEMLKNFQSGGAAINVFARQHQIDLSIIDCGIKTALGLESVQEMRLGEGTANAKLQDAITAKQLIKGLANGATLANKLFQDGCNTLGFGEMGIGNSSAAALITARLCDAPIDLSAGTGTGCDPEQLKHKKKVLRKTLENHQNALTPLEVMSAFGGFEMLTAMGAMLKGAQLGMTLLIDGFIMSSVALAAVKQETHALDYMIFCHESASPGHRIILDELKQQPLLSLGMRLGEGTGVAVAFPILQSACAFMNEMATFEAAEVSAKI